MSSSRQISLFNARGTADVIVDVSGWFGDGTTPTGLRVVLKSAGPPTRVCDTRAGNPSGLSGGNLQCEGKTLGPGGVLTVSVAGLGAVPSENSATPPLAVVLNVTVADTSASSYLTVWPTGETHPIVSDLNWSKGKVIANAVVVTLGSGGQITFFNAQGSVDVIVDVAGYKSGTDVIPPSTIPLSSASMGSLSAVSADQSQLTFAAPNAQLDSLLPGDVIDSESPASRPTDW